MTAAAEAAERLWPDTVKVDVAGGINAMQCKLCSTDGPKVGNVAVRWVAILALDFAGRHKCKSA